MPAHDLVEITDGVLNGLLTSADAMAQLPGLLRPLADATAKAARACGKCGTGAAAKRALAAQLATTRLAVVGLSPQHMTTLKALLDTRQVRVLAGANSQGVPVRHTF
jgi:hypothetical protein